MSFQNALYEFKNRMAEFNLLLQPPATAKDIEDLQRDSLKKFGVLVPNEYVRFLEVTNGFDWNGLLIFSHTNSRNINNNKKTIQGFVDANLAHRSLEDKKDYLIFAESGDDLYAYDTTSHEYQLLDQLTLEKIEQFSSFDALINSALESRVPN
jgi:hypothetical protein